MGSFISLKLKKTLKTNITKFNKIMDALDKFYEENKGLNYYLKVKEY